MKLSCGCVLVALSMMGCAGSVSKSSFTQYYKNVDCYGAAEKAGIEEVEYYKCLPMAKEEYKDTYNRIVSMCVDQELLSLPEEVTPGIEQNFRTSVNLCSTIELLKFNKGKITFDKSPDKLEMCKNLYEKTLTAK